MQDNNCKNKDENSVVEESAITDDSKKYKTSGGVIFG